MTTTTTTKPQMAEEGGHWYQRDGTPCYTVKAKDGSDRPTTLRDARKLELVPSVTTVTRIIAKPALTNWLIGQGVWQALTLTRLADETDDAFIRRAVEMHAETGRLAAERGASLHGALERGDTTGEWAAHVANVRAALLAVGVDVTTGKAEHSFSHPHGYGGKVDAHGDGWILDYKSKDAIGDKTARELAYPEHAQQLAAYRVGLGLTDTTRAFSVFVGASDAKVVIHEWAASDLAHGAEVFFAVLDVWKLVNKYDGSFQL